MTERNKRYLPVAAIAAVALVAAACSSGSDDAAPVASDQTPPRVATPSTASTASNALVLAEGHGITEAEAGDYTIAAGATMKVAGVRFSCDEGDTACTVTVAANAAGVASATYDAEGGVASVALLDKTGAGAFALLSDAIREAGDYDMTDSAGELMSDLYHDEADELGDNPDTDEEEQDFLLVDNGGGVTSSVTGHDEPESTRDDDRVTGVSDIAVVVDPSVMRADEEHASTTVLIEDEDGVVIEGDAVNETTPADANAVTDPWVIMDPVLVDENGNVISTRTANFVADADWNRNPAAEWTTDPALMGATQNMDDDESDIWTNYFQLQQDLTGGRTLHLDLRSDYNANATIMGEGMIIAEGPSSTVAGDDGYSIPWESVSFDDLDVPVGGEINFGTGMPGSYMGVQGTFTCVDDSQSGQEFNICRINRHTPDMMGVSEDDEVMFTPDVYAPDADWLAAGVWFTVPDDEEQGDYAIGAFVYGNDPIKPADATAGNALTGTATYEGDAFGRYAEIDGVHTEVGRFTADAILMADFGGTDGMGTIQGDLTGFMANGQSEDWQVNFEAADIKMGPGDTDNDAMTPDTFDDPLTALRFNAGASGFARGHNLDGYWNGQFYGTPAVDNPDTQDVDESERGGLPGSAAGTFGVTDRDKTDAYSLTMGGAFVTHYQEPPATTTP